MTKCKVHKPEFKARVPLTAELGIGFVAYSPLGRGMFGGEVIGPESLAEGDRRRDHPRFQDAALAHNLRLVAPVRALAEAKGVATAQVALAWVLSRGEHVVAIPGTRRIEHLEANAAAADITLSQEEIARLDAAIPPGAPREPAIRPDRWRWCTAESGMSQGWMAARRRCRARLASRYQM